MLSTYKSTDSCRNEGENLGTENSEPKNVEPIKIDVTKLNYGGLTYDKLQEMNGVIISQFDTFTLTKSFLNELKKKKQMKL